MLNEWYKNDEEVDIRIEATKNMPDYDSTDYIEFDNTHLRNNTKITRKILNKSFKKKKCIKKKVKFQNPNIR